MLGTMPLEVVSTRQAMEAGKSTLDVCREVVSIFLGLLVLVLGP